jgi:transcriptional regulator with XRE-family HTH domain
MNPKDFASFVTSHALRAGYDVTHRRSGGKSQLAKDTGISLSTIVRMFNGQTIPDAYSFEVLADALNVPVTQLLEAAEIFSPGSLTGDHPRHALTVEQAADALGITKPLNVALLRAITATLLADQEAETA